MNLSIDQYKLLRECVINLAIHEYSKESDEYINKILDTLASFVPKDEWNCYIDQLIGFSPEDFNL